MQTLLTSMAVMSGSIDAASRNTPDFLALGDSYTIGEGVAPDVSWPRQLVARLHEAGIAIDEPRIIAVTGWTTDELTAAMDEASFDPPYTLVTLMIGVNNQYRGRDVANYREEFGALLHRAIELAGGDATHVIVVSTPDWGVTRFAKAQGRDPERIAHEIGAFNAAARDIALHDGARFVDVTAASRAAGDAEGQLTDDGLHPSAEQYASWTALILPAARKVLASLTGGPSPLTPTLSPKR